MKRISLFAALAVLFAGPTLAQEPIAIGISIAQSPPGSVVQGTQVKDGVEIVKDMINAKGGVLGRPSSWCTRTTRAFRKRAAPPPRS